MIKQVDYKKFSLDTHFNNFKSGRPSVCQFDLTYACGLHCAHCYVSTYNRAKYIARELSTDDIKKIIDDLKKAGVLWLTFTGGDPLMRRDFCDIYAYAHRQGFLITVFTSAFPLTKRQLALFKRQPPFRIEITLNAVQERLYEKISCKRGSFKKVMAAIKALRSARLPIVFKTMVLKLNIDHLLKIKKYLIGLGFKFDPDYSLHAGLAGNKLPVACRVLAQDIRNCFKQKKDHCRATSAGTGNKPNRLFTCLIDRGDGLYIGPYGNVSFCSLIREPNISALTTGIEPAIKKLAKYFKGLDFKTNSPCQKCDLRKDCVWCPGLALVETGSFEKPIPYYCEIAGKQ